jgi:hypothetical protein
MDGEWRPAVAPYAERAPVLLTLDVDGEVFELREAEGGGTHYDWVSGPNPGYGFSMSGPPIRSVEEHRAHVAAFLAEIDPATGYLADP